MDDLLPSYESTVRKDPWVLVAPYLPSSDLCSAALVCQHWHKVFMPHLWGNPASHFGSQNDTVYVALTRFKRTLFWARLSVRELTHTLHLPPAHAEIYGGPHSDWLRDILERLPCLQCLIVNRLPFFDHTSLHTLRHSSPWWKSTHQEAFPLYGLRFMDASGCSNATPTGLVEALPHFPELVSLDLSQTNAAKDYLVFEKFKLLRNLRVLKLRALGLTDSDFTVVATSIGTRVRSLDVSENHLTDSSIRLLLHYCIKNSRTSTRVGQSVLGSFEEPLSPRDLDIFGTEHLDRHLRKKLTRGFLGRLTIEDADSLGITHLYLSKNSITVEGISGLLRSKRLQVLDVGALPRTIHKPFDITTDEPEETFSLPGAEKLIPSLAGEASQRLTYLRINHAVITENGPPDVSPLPRAEMQGSAAVYKSTNAQELEITVPRLRELDALSSAVYEVPGDATHPAELPATEPRAMSQQPWKANSPQAKKVTRVENPGPSRVPAVQIIPEPQMIKRGSVYAPEPVFPDGPLPRTGLNLEASGGFIPMYNSLNNQSSLPLDEQSSSSRSYRNSIHHAEDLRSRLELRQANERHLHPGMLPKVRTLVLTDVPPTTHRLDIVQRLIQFIKDCAEETEIARIRAKSTYELPPGRSRVVAEKEYARTLFALRRIVLEFAPPKETPKKITTSWRQYPTKSSTEDTDSEAFWEAATHDFSFFGDEECGVPDAEPDRQMPIAAMNGLILASEMDSRPTPQAREEEIRQTPIYDVVSEIWGFRKTAKAAYQFAVENGDVEPMIEGHWPGDISVIRPLRDPEGEIDYYGNRYEAGYLYR
ncbi:hypothetical protein GQ43DRAFT_367555 [Delitschia confertaspora ATCC 74209]|uniref:F-box domain-containing protein n=1 Tax=Delitschia confertaspora ATCC 74209 TaxID=1513339 RepID=A0A9P4JV75_9PLEO|nr:hypothetical protein GQ43DRAFT_367555 [Delitschia confertaspora ATCC 74209]